MIPRGGRAFARGRARVALACAMAIACARTADAAFEWPHAPPAAATACSDPDSAQAFAVLANPAVAGGGLRLAASAARPYSLAGVWAGAVVVTGGSTTGWAVSATRLAHADYGELSVSLAVSRPAGIARAGVALRWLQASVADCGSAGAVACDAGIVFRAGDHLRAGLAATDVAAAGDASLRRAVAPAVSATIAAAAARDVAVSCEARQRSGCATALLWGLCWTAHPSLAFDSTTQMAPFASRIAVLLRRGAIGIGVAYERRPPLDATVTTSLEWRP